MNFVQNNTRENLDDLWYGEDFLDILTTQSMI